jgi:hypothetical protein
MLDKPDFMFGIQGTYQSCADPEGSFPYQVRGRYVAKEGTVKILPREAGPDPPWELCLALRASEMEYLRTRTELGDWALSITVVKDLGK